MKRTLRIACFVLVGSALEQASLGNEFNHLGEMSHLGRIYALKLAGRAIWASMGLLDKPPGAAGGWVVKLDRRTGRILGHLDITESSGGHVLEVLPSGEPIVMQGFGLLWFKANQDCFPLLRQHRSHV